MTHWWQVGRWIWAARSSNATLQHVCFRRMFDRAQETAPARLAITADCV